jgi:flagellar FliL protein
MSEPDGPSPEAGGEKKSKKKLIMIAAPVLLIGIGAGLWFSGIIPGMLGKSPPAAATPAEPASPGGHGGGSEAAPGGRAAPPPTARGSGRNSNPLSGNSFEMPEIVANLNSQGRRASFIKLKSRLELSNPADAAIIQQSMPRLLDLFQTYLREMRPEELRGSAGTHRLREELLTRANLAASPAKIVDVLFVEMLIQ